MITKYLTTALSIGAIALASVPLQVTSAQAEQATLSQTTFICDQTAEPPAIFLQNSDKSTRTVVLKWYSQYLIPGDSAAQLCQSVAKQFQVNYEQGNGYLLAYEGNKEKNSYSVCFVTQEGEQCDSASAIKLFALNSQFVNTPRCFMENQDPNGCPVRISTRGPLISVPGGKYKPVWWPF